MLAIGLVTANGAVHDDAVAGYASAAEIALVTADGAIGNDQRPRAVNATANTRWERISHTSVVVVYTAVGDRQRSTGIEDAAAVALGKSGIAVRRGVVGHCAVYQRHCRSGPNVVDASPGKIDRIAGNVAVKNCQNCITPATIARDRATIGRAVGRQRTVGNSQARVVI